MAFDREIEGHLVKIKNRPERFGNQLITDGEDRIIGEAEDLLIMATDLWVGDAIELVRRYGGHIHPAHIDRESNGIVAILGDIPSEYDFLNFEFNCAENIGAYMERFPFIGNDRVLVCSDAHHLWDINEAENFLMLDDEPYSSSRVRKELFKYFEVQNN